MNAKLILRKNLDKNKTKIYRISLIIVAISFPVIGIFTNFFDNKIYDPIYLRLILSLLSITIITGTYFEKFNRNFNIYFNIYLVLISIWAGYITYENNFSFSTSIIYLSSIAIVSFAISNYKQIGLFSIISVSIITILLISSDVDILSRFSIFISILFIHSVAFAIIYLNNISENNLFANQQKLLDVKNVASIGNWEIDLRNNKIECSDEINNIFECDSDITVKTLERFFSYIHPDDFDLAYTLYSNSFSEKKPSYIEHRIITKNNNLKYLKVRCRTEFDIKGNAIKSHGNAIDITDLKNKETELQESEERYKALHNASFGGIGIHDKGNIIECNRGLSEMTGYSEKELIGMNGLLLIAEESRDLVIKNIKEETEKPYEVTGIRKNGEKYPLHIEARNIPYKGKLMRAVEFRDISEKVNAEQKIIESETKYRMLTDLSGDMIVMHRNFKKFYINPTVEKILGYTQEEFLNFNAFYLLHPEEEDRIKINMEEDRALRIEKNKTCDFRMRHKNGHFVWLSSQIIIHKIDENNFITIISSRDISEKKKIELKLLRSKENLSQAQRVGNVSHWDYDIINDKLYISKQMYNIYEISKENFIPTISNVLEMVPDDERKTLFETFNNSIKEKINLEFIHKIITKKGNIKHLKEVTETKYNSNNEPVSILGSVLDITELKNIELELIESQAIFKAISTAANDAIIMIDNDDTVNFWNPYAEKMFGYTAEEMKGKTLHDYVVPENSREIFISAFESFKKTGKGRVLGQTIELTAINKNKQEFPVEISISRTNVGNKWTAIGIVRDITNKKNYENQLKSFNATKDKLFSIIAHDLKNPFNSLIGFNKLLVANVSDYPKEKIKQIAQNMLDVSSQTYTLLENLLQWSNFQTGKLTPQFIDIKPSELIKEVVYLSETIALAKQINIQTKINCDNYIFADSEMIKTVIRNLISNAIKFTYQNGNINIETSEYNHEILFTISDSGTGIDPEHLKTLFGIDNRYSQRGTANEAGTGLGLMLCKDFIETHKGKIWVESELNKGSKFMFTIPKSI